MHGTGQPVPEAHPEGNATSDTAKLQLISPSHGITATLYKTSLTHVLLFISFRATCGSLHPMPRPPYHAPVSEITPMLQKILAVIPSQKLCQFSVATIDEIET